MSAPNLPTASWTHGAFLGFDTETTGVNPIQERLVTAALVSRDYSSNSAPDAPAYTQQVRTWLADPGVEIPASASAVHGITSERARAEGQPVAQVLTEVADALAAALSATVPVVIFNAAYDLTLMECELARHGLPTLRQRLGGQIAPVLDPLVLDRALDRYRKGKRRLDSLCAVYDVQVKDDLHTAQVDVSATLDVLQALIHTYPQLEQMSLAQVHAFQAAAHQNWAQNFNAWLRAKGKKADADPAWPLYSSI